MKLGGGVEVWDAPGEVPPDKFREALVHADGKMRVPVLLAGRTLVRGFHEPTYREVLLTLP